MIRRQEAGEGTIRQWSEPCLKLYPYVTRCDTKGLDKRHYSSTFVQCKDAFTNHHSTLYFYSPAFFLNAEQQARTHQRRPTSLPFLQTNSKSKLHGTRKFRGSENIHGMPAHCARYTTRAQCAVTFSCFRKDVTLHAR